MNSPRPRFFHPNTSALPAALQASSVTHLNMAGDYSYLSDGYYASLDAEFAGHRPLPTSADALDAAVVPIALAKAAAGGLAVPESDIVVDKLSPPVLAYPVNPFSTRFELITDADELERKQRALTMTGKYAVLCQKLPGDYRIDVVRCVLGRSLIEEYRDFAEAAFAIFKLPLMRVRVIVTSDAYLFSAIEPFPWDTLTLNEKKLLQGLGQWHA